MPESVLDLALLQQEGGFPQGFPLNSTSLAYEASRVVKSGAAKLYGLSVYSSAAAAQWVQLHDATKLPANGAVPVLTITVATVANSGLYFGSVGRWFTRGIVVCNSTTGPTLTIGAADCFFDVQFV